MTLKANLLCAVVLLMILNSLSYGQDKRTEETLTLEQVKERIPQDFINKQRVTVKYKDTGKKVECVSKASGKIIEVGIDRFTLSGDALFGIGYDNSLGIVIGKTVYYSNAITVKK